MKVRLSCKFIGLLMFIGVVALLGFLTIASTGLLFIDLT